MPKHWYVASVKSNQEGLAERELTKQRFEAFVPRIREKVGKSGSRVRPWLRGYILIKFDARRAPWGRINNTRGCSKLFMCGEQPARIRRGVVEEIKSRCSDGFIVDECAVEDVVARIYKEGDVVTVSDGPFSGLSGKVRSSSRSKVLVMLDMFGRNTAAELPHSIVRGLDEARAA